MGILTEESWHGWRKIAKNEKFGGYSSHLCQISTKAVVLFYSALVRSHLLFGTWFLALQFKKDIKKLECVQKRLTKILKTLECKPCLKDLGMFSLRETVGMI